MARSRVINIQRVSLSTPFIRTRKWETTRTQHRSVERKKKKEKKEKICFVAGRSVHDPRNPPRNEIQRPRGDERSVVGIRVSRTSMAVSRVSRNIRENNGEFGITDQAFHARFSKIVKLDLCQKRRSFRRRAKSLRLSRTTIALNRWRKDDWRKK